MIPGFSHREQGQHLYLALCEESMLLCWVVSKLLANECSGGVSQSRPINGAIYQNNSLSFLRSLFLAIWFIFYRLIHQINTCVWRGRCQLYFVRDMCRGILDGSHAILWCKTG